MHFQISMNVFNFLSLSCIKICKKHLKTFNPRNRNEPGDSTTPCFCESYESQWKTKQTEYDLNKLKSKWSKAKLMIVSEKKSAARKEGMKWNHIFAICKLWFFAFNKPRLKCPVCPLDSECGETAVDLFLFCYKANVYTTCRRTRKRISKKGVSWCITNV